MCFYLHYETQINILSYFVFNTIWANDIKIYRLIHSIFAVSESKNKIILIMNIKKLADNTLFIVSIGIPFQIKLYMPFGVLKGLLPLKARFSAISNFGGFYSDP